MRPIAVRLPKFRPGVKKPRSTMKIVAHQCSRVRMRDPTQRVANNVPIPFARYAILF